MKPLVAIDLDDVLAAHHEHLFDHLNESFGSDLSEERWHQRYAEIADYADEWGVTVDAVVDAVHEMVERRSEVEEPLPGAVETLAALAGRFRLTLVTARPQLMRDVTESWLVRHLPGTFEGVHLVGAERWGQGQNASKTPTLQRLGAIALVDDSLRQCREAAAAGLRAICFGHYGWNRADPWPAGVERARDWAEVGALLSRPA